MKRANFKNASAHFAKNKEKYQNIGKNGDIEGHIIQFHTPRKELISLLGTDKEVKVGRLLYTVEDTVVAYIESYVVPGSSDQRHEIAIEHHQPMLEVAEMDQAVKLIFDTFKAADPTDK